MIKSYKMNCKNKEHTYLIMLLIEININRFVKGEKNECISGDE